MRKKGKSIMRRNIFSRAHSMLIKRANTITDEK